MNSPSFSGMGCGSLGADFALIDNSLDFGLMSDHDYLKHDIECITGSESETSSPNSPLYPPVLSNPINNHSSTNNNQYNNPIINNNNNNIIMNNNSNTTNNNNASINHNNQYHNNSMEEMQKKAPFGPEMLGGANLSNGQLWAQLMPFFAAAAAAVSGSHNNVAANAARQFLTIKRSEGLKSEMAIDNPHTQVPPPPMPSALSVAPTPLPVLAPLSLSKTETPFPWMHSSSSSSSISSGDHSSGEEAEAECESDDRQPSDVKRKRLARKAELARMSRKRKKTRMGDLEAEVERLQKEISALKKQIANDDAAAAAASSSSLAEEDDVKKVYATIDSVIEHSKADPMNENYSKQLLAAMDQFVHTHTRSVYQGANHLSALRPHLSPILPLHFLHWIMSQQDRFYEDPSSLWSSLFLQELRLSSDQMKDLSALRTTVKKQVKLLNDIEKGYRKLNTALKKQLTQRVENLEKIRSILTTDQLAKFLAWVHHYGPLCLQKTENDTAQ